jgi:hypothetical protein
MQVKAAVDPADQPPVQSLKNLRRAQRALQQERFRNVESPDCLRETPGAHPEQSEWSDTTKDPHAEPDRHPDRSGAAA